MLGTSHMIPHLLPHDSPPCPTCSKDFGGLGSKLSQPDTEQVLKNCWPGESHTARPGSCFSVHTKLKEMFPDFSKIKKKKQQNQSSRKCWNFYFHTEMEWFWLGYFVGLFLFFFCKFYCFGLIAQNQTSLSFSNNEVFRLLILPECQGPWPCACVL